MLVVMAAVAGMTSCGRQPNANERSSGGGAATGSRAPGAGQTPDHAGNLSGAARIQDAAQRRDALTRVVREWMQQNREGLIAHLQQMPAGPERTEALLATLDRVSAEDGRRALQLAGDLVRSPEERVFFSTYFADRAGQDPAAAARELEMVVTPEARNGAIAAIAAGWARKDADAALAWAGQLSQTAERQAALEAVLAEIATVDPRQALKGAQELLAGPPQQRARRTALAALAAKDPKAAGEFVRTLSPGEAQTNAAIEVARAFAARQADDAVAWARSLKDPNLQRLALLTALESWAAEDAAAAGRYVAGMEPGPVQMSAADRVARVVAGKDPQKAIGWAQSLANSSARDFALVSIASTWARREPAEAVRWASELPAGDSRTQALGAALSYWVLQDAPAAQKFVATLKGDALTHAATTLAPMLAQAGPRAAMDWAGTLPAPEPRDSAIAAAFRRWREISPAEAEAWLKSSKLSSATKTKLQKAK